MDRYSCAEEAARRLWIRKEEVGHPHRHVPWQVSMETTIDVGTFRG